MRDGITRAGLHKSAKVGLAAAMLATALGFGDLSPAKASTVVAAPSEASDVKVFEWGTNAAGADTNANRNAEFVRIKNTAPAGSDPLNVENWVIHDTYQTAGGDWGNRFTFKGASLPAGSPFKAADGTFQIPAQYQVYVYSGSGVDSTPGSSVASVFRNFKHHFNNAGDTIYVRTNKDAPGYVAAVVYTSYRTRVYPTP